MASKKARIAVIAGICLVGLLVAGGGFLCYLECPDPTVLNKARQYLTAHPERFPNKRYLTVIDYTLPSFARRMVVLDLQNGGRESFLCCHGSASGRIFATRFSNQPGSNMSSRGFFVTEDVVQSAEGPKLRLLGLEPGINDNAFSRGMVIHGATYVSYKSVIRNMGRLGRSSGCPSVPFDKAPGIIEKIKGGSLVYIHGK